MQELIRAHIQRSIQAKQKLLEDAHIIETIATAGHRLSECFKAGHKLLTCGNGGSAGDAQHIAAELSIRYRARPERPSLPAISLAADSSALTACGNDFGYERVFARQLEGLGRAGDFLLAISTSGNSANVIAALQAARLKGMQNILLTGGDGGRMLREFAPLVDFSIVVPHEETARIQECHIMIGQILCAVVEKELYGFD